MVEYESGNIHIESGDTNVVIGGSGAKKIEVNNEGTKNYAGADGSGEGYRQLCEEYFEI